MCARTCERECAHTHALRGQKMALVSPPAGVVEELRYSVRRVSTLDS